MISHHRIPLLCLGWACCFLLTGQTAIAQGIRGKVVDQAGVPLPFTAIGVVGSQKGTASNADGDYQLTLAPGRHRIRFQFLGYKTIDTTFTIGSAMIRFEAVMQPEAIALAEAIVTPNGEDPAYTIMRRAIAKARYHTMQVDEYHAKVYVRGSGRLLKTPWLFRKQINKALAEEGIDSTVAFTQESISKLHYIRPDQYRDTVISIRTTGDDNNTSPMSFVYSSFYEPKVVTSISPLAPDAFSHYRFEYLGYIVDNGEHINKIKVTPKGRGDQVFEGVIYIVDNSWSIHSLDLSTSLWGIRFDIQQQFEPVLQDVWMPVHQVYDVEGKIFGFAFEYRYYARVDDYRVQLNPNLEVPVVVIDPKLQQEEARAADARITQGDEPATLSGLDPGTELSTKQLRKMLREYERQEIEAMPEIDTIQIGSSTQQVIDSVAYTRDSAYWESVRPLPLSDYEIRGYARVDSIAALPPDERGDGEEEPDTVTVSFGQDGFAAEVKRRSRFQLSHLVTGGRYHLNASTYLRVKGPLQTINFNTVDGFHAAYDLEVGSRGKQKVRWAAGPAVRYAFSREVANYEGKARLYGKKWSVQLTGGSGVEQFGWQHPISRWENSFYTLLDNRNYLKQYEQVFGRLEYHQEVGKGYGVDASLLYADRHRLVNRSDLVFFDSKNRLYTPNDPDHISGNTALYADHEAIVSDLAVWAKPFWRYRVSQGAKRKVFDRSPTFRVRYRKGWGQDYHPFDLIAGEVDYKVNIGAGSLFSFRVAGGTFVGSDRPVYFQDFAHLPGNRMLDSPMDPVSEFRMLPYYRLSTNEEYAYGLFNYQFRRFALTQFHYFRRQGIRENLIFNALLTPTSNQYMEVGYALNYILRFLRIEFVTSWQDLTYQDFAVRFGVATDLRSIFNF